MQDRPDRIERLREEERRLARLVQREREIIERMRASAKNKNYNNYNNSLIRFFLTSFLGWKRSPWASNQGQDGEKMRTGYEDGRNLGRREEERFTPRI